MIQTLNIPGGQFKAIGIKILLKYAIATLCYGGIMDYNDCYF